MDDAGWVSGVLHSMTSGPLGGHQMSNGACGAQSSGGGVRVEVGLGREVSRCSRSQVGVNRTMAGTIVWEGVRSLSYCRSDVGLLSPVTPCAISRDVLLGLAEIKRLLLLEMWSWPLLPIGNGSRRAP